MRGAFVLSMVAAATAACADPPRLPDLCADELAPRAPTVMTAMAGRKDITAASFAVDVSPPDDPDGDLLWSTDYEVWTRNADGSLRERTWYASIVGSHPPPLTLADGRFDNSAAATSALELWRDHAIRVRHISRSEYGCEQVGEWSPLVGFRTDDGSLPLFDSTIVRDVEITLSAASYAAIDAQARPPGCVPYERDYYTGDLRYLDTDFLGVGVKVKGGCGSARHLDRKAGFKISLDWDDPAVAGCPAPRRVGGLDGLTINNMVQDRSLTHERMGYELFRRMGVPVPRTAPLRVFVNGTLFGYYLHVETVDRRFLARHFDSNDGMLYEGTYRCDLVTTSVADDDSGCMTREFSQHACDGPPPPGADPIDYTPLHQLIAGIDALPPGGFYPAIDSLMDFDRYLSMWAVEAVLSHWDGYTYNIINNFRLYHDPSDGRWTIIPSGLDQTFQNGGLDDLWSPSGRLATSCMREPACEAAFAGRLAAAIDLFEAMQLEQMRASIVAQWLPLVTAAPGREFDLSAFDGANAATATYIRDRPAQVRAALAQRGH